MTGRKLRAALGIDVGGTNIRGAVVDFSRESIAVGEIFACPTPQPSTTEAVARAVQSVRDALGWDGSEAIGFPARLRAGIVEAVSNLDRTWVGIDVSKRLSAESRATAVINDADAAGLAESEFGAASGSDDLVLVLTVGTGIGSALVHGGMLIEGTELGLMPCESVTAQRYAAMSTIDRDELSLAEWAGRLGTVLQLYEELLAPEVIVIGGAAATHIEKFRDVFDVACPVRPAYLGSSAGVIGAAFVAARLDGQGQ